MGGPRHAPHEERLCKLSLITLERRTPRADFKVLQSVIGLSPFDFFLCHAEDALPEGCKSQVVFDEENVRVVKLWDKVLGSIVMSPSMPAFKAQLDPK